MTQRLVGFHHLHHKRALTGDQVIAGTDASKDPIKNRHLCRLCGYETADLRHND